MFEFINNFGQNIFWLKNRWVQKILVKKHFESKNILGLQNLELKKNFIKKFWFNNPKKIFIQTIAVCKNYFGPKNLLVHNFGPKMFGLKKMLGPKKFSV